MKVSRVHGEYGSRSVSEIAMLSTSVFAAYRMGDAAAGEILENEMGALAFLIDATCKLAGNRVNLCGGVMEHHSDVLIPILRGYVSSEIQFVLPKLPPIYGACVECCSRMEIPMDERFAEVFEQDYVSLKTNQ